jgi:hypothetical protein
MNTTKFLNNYAIHRETFTKNVRGLRSALFSNGICWTDNVHGQFSIGIPFRVVLFTHKVNADFKNPMAKECNGLVYEYTFVENANNVKPTGWRLLAMPLYAFCSNKISMKKLDALYSTGHYDTYEVLDATILTLYYYNGQWRVSSTKAYDIGDTDMTDGFTFMDAIRNLIQTKYKAFQFENLNEHYSYTIALRHHKYHIFDEAKHMGNRTKRTNVQTNGYIMVMCVADPKTGRYLSKTVSGLPHQTPMEFKGNNLNKANKAARTEEVEKENNANNEKQTGNHDTKSVHTLINYARSAYAKYAKAHHVQTSRSKPLYGYILRAKQGVPNEYTTIYIESDLFRAIKVALYKDNSLLRSMNYNELAVRMLMNNERYAQFKIMFHQFAYQFSQLENAVTTVALATVERMRGDAKLDVPTKAESMIQEMIDDFKAEHNITSGIIKDTMFSNKYVHYLHEVLE